MGNTPLIRKPALFSGRWYTIASYDLTNSLEAFDYTYDCTAGHFNVTRRCAGETQHFRGTLGGNTFEMRPPYGEGTFTETILFTDYIAWTIVYNTERDKLRVMSRSSVISRRDAATLTSAIAALGWFDCTRLRINPSSVDASTVVVVPSLIGGCPPTYPVSVTPPVVVPVGAPSVVVPSAYTMPSTAPSSYTMSPVTASAPGRSHALRRTDSSYLTEFPTSDVRSRPVLPSELSLSANSYAPEFVLEVSEPRVVLPNGASAF